MIELTLINLLKHGAGTGEFNPKNAARSKELHLSSSLTSLKPPKISEQASRISRASLGANHVKLKTQSVEAASGEDYQQYHIVQN